MRDGPLPADPPCAQVVDLLTDYLDGALAARDTVRLEAHLAECPGCATVLDQLRATIALTGVLRTADVEQLDPVSRGELLEVFRRWAAGRPAR